jgi:hypothetical protein
MALTTNTQSNAAGIVNRAQGQVVTDAGAAADTTFTCGFIPRYIKFVNATDRIVLEFYEGMAANSALRTVAAGTVTLDVAAGITLGTTALNTAGQFTVKAADIPASKTLYWEAIG